MASPSIQRRLLLPLGLGFGLLAALMGLYALLTVRQQATRALDTSLLARAATLASLVEQEGEQLEFDYEPGVMPEFERDVNPDYFQLLDTHGASLHRSAALESDLRALHAPAATPRLHDIDLPDGRPGRLVEMRFVPTVETEGDGATPEHEDSAGRSILLRVATSRSERDALMSSVLVPMVAGGALAALLASLLAWWVVGRALRPLDAIAAQVEGLDADSLGERITLERPTRELDPVVHRLNALLTRLATSFERERRFAGNVAHELRTPLTELRTIADVGRRWPDDRDVILRFFDDVDGIAVQMERVIADLLLLARCHAGVEEACVEEVDLSALVREQVEVTQLAPEANAPTVRLRLDEPLHVRSDPSKLAIVLRNLLANARQYGHAPEPIVVHATAHQGGERFRVCVRNSAPHLTRTDLEHLTEPFWRKDAARTSSANAGLGLSVVESLAALLGLGLTFDQDAEGRFRAQLEGPADHALPRRSDSGDTPC